MRMRVHDRYQAQARHTPQLAPLVWICGLILLLIPRGGVARETTRSASNTDDVAAEMDPVIRRVEKIQRVVDEFSVRLAVSERVVVSVVPKNELLVSVERLNDRDKAFGLSFEEGFFDLLSDRELDAAVAHELGHVWIFCHHPYLQTEDLANDIALRVVSRQSLNELYDKVWNRVGATGHLVHPSFP